MKFKLLSLTLLTSQLSLSACGGYGDFDTLIAHEWGTFTSVQGADGVQMPWNPLLKSDLPGFVYDYSKPSGHPRRQFAGTWSKGALRTLQRMETPVIYFYSDRERSVDVTVKFPQGLITEWYPQAQDIGPSVIQPRPAFSKLDAAMAGTGLPIGFSFASLDTRNNTKDSLIRWSAIKVLPGNDQAASLIPTDKSPSHYFAARETDAALLRVNAVVNNSTVTEHEKFLFYRGVGSFTAPLRVTTSSDGNHITLNNTGTNDLAHLFVLQVRDGQAKFNYLERLTPRHDQPVRLEPNKDLLPLADATAQISSQMRDALVKQGLLVREAEAMVKTWRDSWFEEPGLRVFYVLPKDWVDRTLPLEIKPQPKQIARVFVGRAEIITPALEEALLKQITQYTQTSPAGRAAAIENTRKLNLGRFAEPALQRALRNTPAPEFNQAAWELLAKSRATAEQPPKVASR